MGRPEQPLDPLAGPVERLAAELRRLRDQNGRPSYRELARRTHFSRSTLAEAAAGVRLPTLEAALAYAEACGGDRAEWERKWHLAADELQRTSRRSPYPGLFPLGTEDTDLFFGRDRLLEDLLKAVQRSRLTVVTGASGSGKSSLLRAGLLARLAAEGTPARLVSPGARPVFDAAEGVLVIDQFEEVFTLCSDERERDAYFARLSAAVAEEDGPAAVIGIRADFHERCVRHPGLAAALRDSAHVPVAPMSEEEMRAAVTGPASRVGLTVEPDLVAAVLTDAADQTGALPMVAHALRETWNRQRGDTLRLAHYREAGGVAGAIARTAERLYAELDGVQRGLLRAVLLRLTAPNGGTADARRRIERDELTGIEPAGELDTVLDLLAAARLVVVDHDTIDIAHEALIHAWPRLREWLTDDREALLRHQRLVHDAIEWERNRRGGDYLYRGERLAAWEGADFAPLNDLERSFLAASRTHADVERAAARRRRRLAIGGLCLGAALVSVLTVVALVQAGRADGAQERAASVRLALEARRQLAQDPELALLLAIEAYEAGPTREADTVLRQATADARLRGVRPTGLRRADGMAVAADGRRAVVWGAGTAADAEIWSLDGPAPRRERLSAARNVLSAAFGPDGRLVTGHAGGEVRLWNAAGEATVLGTAKGSVRGVSVAPDGRVASAHDDGVRIWDPAGRSEPVKLEVPGRSVASVAFSPTGQRLATGGSGSPLHVWSMSGKRPRLIRAAPRGGPEEVAFSRAGPWAATVEGDVPRLWNVLEELVPTELTGHSPRLNGVAFSQAGDRVAAFGADGLIRVWSTGGDADPLVLRTPGGDPRGAAFDSSGKTLTSVDADGTLRHWDVAVGEQAPSDGRLVALSPDGGTLATAASAMSLTRPQDLHVRIWRGSERLDVRGPSDAAYRIALSPDGRQMAALGRAGTLSLWNLATGARTTAPAALKGLPVELAFSPDGKRLAAGAHGTEPLVWQVAPSGTLSRLTGWERRPTGKADGNVALSPGGALLADARDDGTVVLWDLTGRSEPEILRGHRESVTSMAFDPAGRRLAAAATDGAVRLWNTTGGEPTAVLRGGAGAVRKVRFSPDGGWLLTDEPDGRMRLWRPSGGEPVELAGWGQTGGLAAFTTDGARIVRGLSPRVLPVPGTSRTVIRACEVCGPSERVLALAKSRRTRELTAEERRTHLG
ncbi:helix-turn-helix domain-containing protein [Spirillospora sp. NPDC127200]